MERVIQSLNAIRIMSPELIDHLQSILKQEKFLKREYLLREDQTCNKIRFITEGIVGCFYEKSDKTLCAWFMTEGDVVVSVASFFLQKPSYEDIIALDNTEVLYITHEQLENIYERFPEFNYHGRVLLQKYYIMAEERMRAFHNQSPEEKFKYIMKNYPDLFLRVSNQHLARYMGITDETLSRLKVKIRI